MIDIKTNQKRMIALENNLTESMNIKQAAEYIGASTYKLRDMVHNKEIKHYRIGNRIMFRKVSLDEWMAQQEALNSAGE